MPEHEPVFQWSLGARSLGARSDDSKPLGARSETFGCAIHEPLGARSARTNSKEQLKEQLKEDQDLAPSVRKRDETWDALMAVCGVTSITPSARGAYNRACADLKAVGATSDEIVEHGRTFRSRWPDVSLTPTALARRWGETDPARQHAPAPPKGHEMIQRALQRAEGQK
jgi:hypothetical protein